VGGIHVNEILTPNIDDKYWRTRKDNVRDDIKATMNAARGPMLSLACMINVESANRSDVNEAEYLRRVQIAVARFDRTIASLSKRGIGENEITSALAFLAIKHYGYRLDTEKEYEALATHVMKMVADFLSKHVEVEVVEKPLPKPNGSRPFDPSFN
jgi:hypothetical protein